MEKTIIKLALVVLLMGGLINNYKENHKIVFQNTMVNKMALKSDEVSLPEPIVYENLTKSELVAKIEKAFTNELDGKAEFLVDLALEREVDPVVAASIMLLETGCKWNCSYLAKSCNNIGGMRGSGCNGYAKFSTLDEGITIFLNNLSNNYYKKGLTTPELMNKKYAESQDWYIKVNKYVEAIKAN